MCSSSHFGINCYDITKWIHLRHYIASLMHSFIQNLMESVLSRISFVRDCFLILNYSSGILDSLLFILKLLLSLSYLVFEILSLYQDQLKENRLHANNGNSQMVPKPILETARYFGNWICLVKVK